MSEPDIQICKPVIARTFSTDIRPATFALMNQVATHCANRAEQGLGNIGFEEHPDPLIRFASEIGHREGLFVAAAARKLKSARK